MCEERENARSNHGYGWVIDGFSALDLSYRSESVHIECNVIERIQILKLSIKVSDTHHGSFTVSVTYNVELSVDDTERSEYESECYRKSVKYWMRERVDLRESNGCILENEFRER